MAKMRDQVQSAVYKRDKDQMNDMTLHHLWFCEIFTVIILLIYEHQLPVE